MAWTIYGGGTDKFWQLTKWVKYVVAETWHEIGNDKAKVREENLEKGSERFFEQRARSARTPSLSSKIEFQWLRAFTAAFLGMLSKDNYIRRTKQGISEMTYYSPYESSKQ